MSDSDYKQLMKDEALNAVKQITGQGDQSVEVDDEQYRTPDPAPFVKEVSQIVGEATKKGTLPIVDALRRYEAYRSAVNGRSFYRHQTNRASKTAAALNMLSATSEVIADIVFKEQ